MRNQLIRFWRDIKGNVKFALVVTGSGAVISIATWLTHGLSLGQQVGLMAVFAGLLAWAIIASVAAFGKPRGNEHIPHEDETPASQMREPPLSQAEQLMLNKAKSEFRSLPWNQKVALRLVYSLPNQFMGLYCRHLKSFGFADSDSIMEGLVQTTLVSTDGRMNVGPSQHPVVTRAAQKLLDDAMIGI